MSVHTATDTSRRRFPLLVAAATAIASLATLAAFDAAVPVAAQGVDATVTQVGWWTDKPLANEVGDGGFEVSTGPDGTPDAVAAFTVDIAATSVTAAEIVLHEAAAVAEFSSLKLCPTSVPWDAADPGAFDDAPEPDCATAFVNLTRTIDTQLWFGDVTPLLTDGGTVSVMVLPEYAPPAPLPLGSGMLVRVDSIELAVEGSSAPATTTSTTLDFTTPGGGNTFDDNPDSSLGGGFTPPSGGGVDLGSVGGGPVDDLGSNPPPDPVEASNDDEFFTLGPVESTAGKARPWWRLALILPLSAAAGLGSSKARDLWAERATVSA